MQTEINIQSFSEKIISNLEKVIIGKRHILELTVIALLGHGHVLIDDIPGIGKTMLAKTIAKSLRLDFKRIQFTPDMLPSDVTGISIFDQATKKFEFRQGPIFTDILLADEINRATPKTQSALLEAMEEYQVTVDGITHRLSGPFTVLATQNPIEYEGTFSLPEAQLDRFFMSFQIGYPALADEIRIIENQQFEHPFEKISAVTNEAELRDMQNSVKSIFVSDDLKKYIIHIIKATRENKDIYLGASPRGSIMLTRGSQIYAAISGRKYVIPDDVKYIATSILSHRIILQPTSRLKNITSKQVIEDILVEVAVPGGKFSLD